MSVLSLPASGVLSAWLGGVLTGRADPDGMLDALESLPAVHQVEGLEAEPLGLVRAVGALRRRGATGCSLSLPVPGDLVGLAGPPAFNTDAVEAGQAVVVTGAGTGLVPDRTPWGYTWRALPAESPPPPDLYQAGTDLRRVLAETTDRLLALDVARWRPEIADLLGDLRHQGVSSLPPQLEPRRVQVVDRALLCREVVMLAIRNDGGAVTAREIEERRAAMIPLERAARHALVAACSM